MKDEESDVITDNFKGRIRSIITYTGSDGTEKTKESVTDVFATILIRVIGFKEIYEAWEEQYQSALEDYNPNETTFIQTQGTEKQIANANLTPDTI
jgi:hypothetical protein